MPDTRGAGIGRAYPAPRQPARGPCSCRRWPPLPAGAGLQVQRPELIHAEDHSGSPGPGTTSRRRWHTGARPGPFHRVIRVLRGLPRLQALTGDALLAEQDPQALMADAAGPPPQRPGTPPAPAASTPKTAGHAHQALTGRLLDLPPRGQGELRQQAPGTRGTPRAEPISAEPADHIPDPVLTGKRPLAIAAAAMPGAGSSTIRARRPVTTDPPPRRTIRTSRAPSSSPISRTRRRSGTGPVCRISTLANRVRDGANVTCYGTRPVPYQRPGPVTCADNGQPLLTPLDRFAQLRPVSPYWARIPRWGYAAGKECLCT